MMLKRLAAIHDHRAADTLRRVLAADQMPLDQHLLFQRGKILEQLRKRILHLGQLLHARLDQLQNLRCAPLSSPSRERHAAGDCAPAARGC